MRVKPETVSFERKKIINLIIATSRTSFSVFVFVRQKLKEDTHIFLTLTIDVLRSNVYPWIMLTN